jgi:hypothetical protein
LFSSSIAKHRNSNEACECTRIAELVGLATEAGTQLVASCKVCGQPSLISGISKGSGGVGGDTGGVGESWPSCTPSIILLAVPINATAASAGATGDAGSIGTFEEEEEEVPATKSSRPA